ncbi:MAG: fructosamine kinase family protein, partial [Anaerolineae bacterium]|nr:fructosamine kinase family protein [Anaerolineae bacterium]
AYRATFPLEPGYEERRALYQLYPLLVHYNLFGEPYGAHVEAICRRYV